jgi:predicted nucleic acid-binding protein
MKVFCDTSVLVASSLQFHPHYAAAAQVVEHVVTGRWEGVLGTHSLAEAYSVLTRYPTLPLIQPEEASRLVLDNIAKHFSVIVLNEADYIEVIRRAAENGFGGGLIYDALLLACGVKARADRIYTFNVAHFRRLAPEGLQKKILAP